MANKCVKKIKAIVLDFDGVIVESNAVKDAAFSEFFARYPQYTEAMQVYHDDNHALPRRHKFAYLVEVLMQRPGDAELINNIVEEFSALTAARVIACPEVPGAEVFLEEFAKHVPLYISSVTPQEELLRIIEARGISSHFRHVFGNPPHPKAEAIGVVLERERLQPNEIAFVGDSESDRQVALQTGLIFFARNSGQLFGCSNIELSVDMDGIAQRLRPMVGIISQ